MSTFKESMRHAYRGLRFTFANERNFRVQTAVAFVVFVFSLAFPLSRTEFLIIILVIFSILGIELFNTVIERFLDVLKPRLHEQVGILKDIMAGTVLLFSFGAAAVGLYIFIPHIVEIVLSL